MENFKQLFYRKNKTMKLRTLFFSLILSGFIQAQEFKSSIKKVTVFQQGAQVHRKARISLEKGITTIVIKNISRYVDASSIQAKVPGSKIISLSYSLDYLVDKESNLEKSNLESKVESLNHELKVLNNQRQINQQELKLIEKNVDLKGQEVLDVADLQDFLIFYRSTLPMIKGSLLSIEENEKKIRKELKKLKKELKSLNSSSEKVFGKVEIELSSPQKNTVDLLLNYYVSNAGWTPYYNLRASALDAPIEMEFNAHVYQNTGLDWSNIALTLATGTPHLDGNAPELRPWYVNLRRKGGHRFKLKGNVSKREVQTDSNQLMSAAYSVSAENNAPVSTSENMTFREYKINVPYNISSNGKRQRVEITNHTLPAEYAYFSAPKISPAAYLMAKVADWENFNILSGNSNIYFEDTYVGQVFIDGQSTEDTLNISLGQDKNIVIERVSKLDKSGKQLIGLKQSKKKAFDIVVRNNKSSAIKIEIVDQIPVSKNNDVKVKLGESSSAQVNMDNGELKWHLNLGAFEKASKFFEFEISYPKNKKISL